MRRLRRYNEYISKEEVQRSFIYLLDDGFTINKKNYGNGDVIEIYKINTDIIQPSTFARLYKPLDKLKLKWSDIKIEILPFIERNIDIIKNINITYPGVASTNNKTYSETILPDAIVNKTNIFSVLKILIFLKK